VVGEATSVLPDATTAPGAATKVETPAVVAAMATKAAARAAAKATVTLTFVNPATAAVATATRMGSGDDSQEENRATPSRCHPCSILRTST